VLISISSPLIVPSSISEESIEVPKTDENSVPFKLNPVPAV
jgi:hypothetical protein